MRREVLQTVEQAERVIAGHRGELLAVRMLEPEKAMIVVYRELNNEDGFIITAFITRKLTAVNRRSQVWPPPS